MKKLQKFIKTSNKQWIFISKSCMIALWNNVKRYYKVYINRNEEVRWKQRAKTNRKSVW